MFWLPSKDSILVERQWFPLELVAQLRSTAVAILTVRPNVELDPLYLAVFISSSIGKEQIERRRPAATAQPYIPRGDLARILIPLPPLQHQRELTRRIVEMMSEVHRLSEQAAILEGSARSLVAEDLKGGEYDR